MFKISFVVSLSLICSGKLQDKMKLLQCAVTFYLLTCCDINDTSVNQVKMSRCRDYGTCYNSDWCNGVLSSRNYSETHLVRKLECLTALHDDRSNVSQWSNTIDNLTNNVSMTIKRVNNLTDEMVSIKGTVTDTTIKLNEHCKETEELNKKIKHLEEDCETLKGNFTDLGDVRIKMDQQDKAIGETINVLAEDFNNLKNSFESFKSDIGIKHTDIDAKVINASRDNEDSIKNSEKKLKDHFEKEILESNHIINALLQNVTANQEQLNKTLRSLNQTVSEQENRFNESLNELNKEMHDRLDIFEKKNKNLDDTIKHVKNEMDRDIQTKTESVRQTLDDNIDRISKDLERKIEDVSTSANTKIDNTIAELKKLSKRLSDSENNLKNRLKSETEKLQSSIDANMKKLNTELENFKKNTDKRFENFVMAFMILTVIECLLAVAVFNIYQRLNSTGPNNTDRQTPTRPQRINMDAKEILRKIPRNPVLKPDVCLISYDEARKPAHKKLLDSANVPECNIISHVIRMHEHILDLPKCKVYLMCTEFSERHVIIEEPGLGLGDLHRTTYDAVLQLGGCLIILYTRDPGSRRLKNDALYNKNIYCVTKQKELSVLEKDNCFFSTYDELTDHQKTELRKKIVEKMK